MAAQEPHPEPGRTDGKRRTLHARLSVFILAFGVGFSLFYLVAGAPRSLTLSIVAATSASAVLLWRVRNGMSSDGAATSTGLVLWFAFTSVAYHYGGLDTPACMWLLVTPTVTLSLGSWEAARVAVVATIGTFVGLFVLHQFDQIPTPWVDASAARVLVLVNLPVMTILLVGMMRLAHMNLEARSARLEQANAELHAEVEHRARIQRDLEDTRSRLVDAARHAGRAEVATGALHNIGNALNSVSVAAAQARQILLRQRTGRIADVATLLADREPKVSAFTDRLGGSLERERTHALREVEALIEGLQHVARVVSAQQSFARHRGVEELVDIEDLARQAAHLVSLPAHVDLRIEATQSVGLTADRHRILQILANLIKNAGDACACALEPAIEVRIDTDGSDVRIEVHDNGEGFSPELRDRIFAHGFTTKQTGSGFGLHASALAARELGGALTADSPGLGRGATFVLTLPREGPATRPATTTVLDPAPPP